MKYLKTPSKLLALALLPLLLGGCLNDLFEQRDRTYQGPSVLEFYPITQTVNESNSETVSAGTEIQLIGPQQSSAIQANFSVDGSSTAEAGTHYNLVTSSPATIGANSSQTEVTVEVIPNSLPDGETRELVLSLDGGSGDIGVAANYDTYTLTIRGQ